MLCASSGGGWPVRWLGARPTGVSDSGATGRLELRAACCARGVSSSLWPAVPGRADSAVLPGRSRVLGGRRALSVGPGPVGRCCAPRSDRPAHLQPSRVALSASPGRGITTILTAPEAVGRLEGAWDAHFSRPAAESVIQSGFGMLGSGPAGQARPPGPAGPVSSRNVNVPSQHERTFLPSFWG